MLSDLIQCASCMKYACCLIYSDLKHESLYSLEILGTKSCDAASALVVECAVKRRMNCLFVGEAGTGKVLFHLG